MSEHEIPEDLRTLYSTLCDADSGPCDLCGSQRELIERIATLHADLNQQKDIHLHYMDALCRALGMPEGVEYIEAVKKVMADRKRLYDALKAVQPFVEKEHECREHSYLPDPTEAEDDYLAQSEAAVETIRAAITAHDSKPVAMEGK